KVLFLNSGSESVEAAIKFARAATGRPGIIYCEHAFHGLSCGALSLNGCDIFRNGFEPLLPNCVRVAFNDLVGLERALHSKSIAAFIVEPIQGKGVNMPTGDYLKTAADLCRKRGTLFVADEVQTGLGRTGRFLAVDHWNVEPDMVLLAKTLSGGHVPVAALLARKKVFDKVFDSMERAVVHGSTFGGYDLAMAAGIATLDVLAAEKLVDKAVHLGDRLLQAIAAMIPRYEFLKDVRGKGLMIGMELGPPQSVKLKASWHALEAAKAGLFCQLITMPLFKEHKVLSQVASHGSHTIKLLPSLVISVADCEWTVSERSGAIWSLGKAWSAIPYTLTPEWDRARARFRLGCSVHSAVPPLQKVSLRSGWIADHQADQRRLDQQHRYRAKFCRPTDRRWHDARESSPRTQTARLRLSRE